MGYEMRVRRRWDKAARGVERPGRRGSSARRAEAVVCFT
ncbi:uncharacterized protein G2W53_031188 [Senna tora]|uniref:Uncharacterized protein n=1 Tax=Senna tora TaxID=362788 RepID=A0A834WHI0_9FABA|nr:uncharacterized protein G2W53_031188 [Senna tora]